MISIITILLFFVYLWGLGFTATYYLKKPTNFLENLFLNFGIGLGIFSILSILLNVLHIPLDWKIFLVLSLVFPAYILIKKLKDDGYHIKLPNISNIDFTKFSKSTAVFIVVFLIASVSFYVYASGAFSYPYLENEDPWGHSEGIKYISIEKNAYDPEVTAYPGRIDPISSYVDPYPPAYDILLAMLHQTSVDLKWTMKFFNALIISLGFIFFYLFAKRFTGSRNKALFATFVLAAIPSYLSHFIWAHSLVVTLVFPTMYAFDMIRDDKRWTWVALILVGGVWVSQNISHPFKITCMILIYLIVASITYRKFLARQFGALLGGMVLSLLWWGAMIIRHGFNGFVSYYAGGSGLESSAFGSGTVSASTPFVVRVFLSFFDPGGSSSRAYTLKDFFIAEKVNMINNPIGVGLFVSVLALIGLVYVLWKYKSSIVRKENTWIAITVFWLIFTFWGVNGITFPISVARGSFRVWMLMAIPVALLAAEGSYFLKNLTRLKILRWLIVVVLLVGILFTSAHQKYELNTATWPTSSAFASPREAFEYGYWAETLPPNTRIFIYTPRPKIVTGLGHYSCNWCDDELNFRNRILEVGAVELHSFLKAREYEYLLINPSMDFRHYSKRYDEETVQLLPQRYNEIQHSGLFTLVYQQEDRFFVFKLN